MRLIDLLEIWELKHPNSKFLDDIEINSEVDKDTLWDYLISEYGSLRAIDDHTEYFHFKVDNFFKIHKFNIDKLCETMKYQYEPLDNFRFRQDLGRETDDTKHYNKDQKIDRGAKSSTIEHGQMNRTYGESGNEFEQQANLISAYNDNESPQLAGVDENGNPVYTYIDTEKDRRLTNRNYRNNGNENVANDVGSETVSIENVKDGTEYDERGNEQVGEVIKRTGTANVTFQSLIKEEREIAEFNIYKWIGRHFSNELLIGVW